MFAHAANCDLRCFEKFIVYCKTKVHTSKCDRPEFSFVLWFKKLKSLTMKRMDSEDSRDAGDTQSTSSSSSSSSRSRRSSSSDSSKTAAKSQPHSPSYHRPNDPQSPSPERHSRPIKKSSKRPHTPDNLSGAHSDINSPENSRSVSPALGPKSPEAPKSPSDIGSNIESPEQPEQYSAGPKSPQSPNSSVKSPVTRSQPVSPDSSSQIASPTSRNPEPRSRSSSPSPERTSPRSSPRRSPVTKNEWDGKDKWRRHTKAEQKMMSEPRERSQSESSQSSRSSSYNKRTSTRDPATEEISDGEMESDHEDRKSRSRSIASDRQEEKEKNLSHEDLSDVSDLDSEGDDKSVKTKAVKKQEVVNGIKSQASPKAEKDKVEPPKMEKVPQEKNNTEDGEEQLDFEAEEGECVEPSKPKEQSNGDVSNENVIKEEVKAGKRSRGSSLEEGEVSDEAERRPEESEPRPVCRFFARGGFPPTVAPRDQPPPESAWERGLRTAKEMLRIANKRKEQDMDFEEKKLHLSVGGVVHDPDAELAYVAAAVGASPPPPLDAPPPARETEVYSRTTYGAPFRGRGFPRGPRRVRSSREVIVQRAEVESGRREGREVREVREGRREGREGRSDEWADPWMRAEPAARKKRMASTEDSYSSSRLSPSVIVRERRLATARATAMNPPAPRRRAPSPVAARQMAVNPPPPASHRHKDDLDLYGRKTSGKKRSATSPIDSGASKKSVSRREELLKQLKAVEDAIARKRSKI
ncbi:unnamed protein product [Leptidea sinapis]|uniref:Uncharacterized protein n=2 Tax=Leptidea sinapis TaxID=189913 RepID=A0A5E4QY89_9NEOP|nr:unnamed protein product [Leptidea sinapis]